MPTALTADLPALVDNLVALALFRRREPPARQAETLAMPEELHVWETAGGGEIDFVCGRRLWLRRGAISAGRTCASRALTAALFPAAPCCW